MRFDIAGRRGDRIRMPAVFQDVMRDLIANARKYTDPGGRILAGVYEDETELRFAVADTGRGIPEDEIPKLVQFGTRGSNVGDRPTRGGGFGLTKAYYITKKLGGRMWIESELHSGTEMRLAIPTSRGGELRSDFSMEDRQ
jgi:signal transduction histidine kinase